MASTGKKKKRNSLLFLAGCIVLFGAAYVGASVYQKKQEEAEEAANTEQEIELLNIDADSLTEISFENSYGAVHLVQEGGKWKYADDKRFPLKQESAKAMAEIASGLNALRVIVEEPEDLTEYGLEEPGLTVEFCSTSGKKTLYLGDQSPSSDSGYYCLSDGAEVYEVSSDVYSAFDYSLSELMTLEEAPTITSSQITELTIEETGKKPFHAVPSNISDSSTWGIREPYETEVPGDDSGISTFLGSYESIGYEGAVEYNCRDFTKYGLNKKKPAIASIRAEYYEMVEEEAEVSENSGEDSSEEQKDSEEETTQVRVDHELNILVGNQDEDGNFYIRVNGSPYVYLMSESDVDSLIPDDAYTYINKTVAKVSMGSVKSLKATVGEKEYNLYSREKTTVNDDGEEETETEYFSGKKKIDIDDYNAVGAEWNLITIAKEVPEKKRKSLNQERVVMTVSVEGTGIKQEVSFLEYDKSYYAVLEEDCAQFLVDKRTVDAMIEKLGTVAE